ncbi:MAG: hypothetical protein PHD36_00065 [Desulfotomaculaceae bacterium]|nr:hypothetical protein [Desulfotomaculaceae bacterium]
MEQDRRARVREQAGVWVRAGPVAGKVVVEEVSAGGVVAGVVAREPDRVRAKVAAVRAKAAAGVNF